MVAILVSRDRYLGSSRFEGVGLWFSLGFISSVDFTGGLMGGQLVPKYGGKIRLEKPKRIRIGAYL